MSHVVAVYTTLGLVEPLRRAFGESLPGVRLTNLVDDSLLRDVVQAGGVTEAVEIRLGTYYATARDLGADLILNTCSSVGEVAAAAHAAGVYRVPIVRIDEPMAREAVALGPRIAVLATLPTTLAPTARLIQNVAAAEGAAPPRITEVLAAGAYDALMSGKTEEHDRLLEEAARGLADTDVLVLAQGSMARVAPRLRALAGVPVLSSLPGALAEIARRLDSPRGGKP